MENAVARKPDQDEHYCSSCGEIIKKLAEICPKCGVRLRAPPTTVEAAVAARPQSSGRKTTAAILALLLGGFGTHKFYLGQPIMGLFYLLFCWTLIPAIAALIEGIILLTMSDEKFESRYPG